MAEPIRTTWRHRGVPLRASAVVAHLGAVVGLARSARDRLAVGADLSAAAGVGYLVVVGDETDLPWTDSAVYVGWEAGVLLPTTREPVPRVALLAVAARRGADPNDVVIVLPRVVLHVPSLSPLRDPEQLAALAAGR